jgi:hypothetical protein
MNKAFVFLLSASLLCGAVYVTADTNVVTDPVGFYKITLLTNSDREPPVTILRNQFEGCGSIFCFVSVMVTPSGVDFMVLGL